MRPAGETSVVAASYNSLSYKTLLHPSTARGTAAAKLAILRRTHQVHAVAGLFAPPFIGLLATAKLFEKIDSSSISCSRIGAMTRLVDHGAWWRLSYVVVAAADTQTEAAIVVARLDRWLQTMRGPGGCAGPISHWWESSFVYCGPMADWRYEGIVQRLRHLVSLDERSGLAPSSNGGRQGSAFGAASVRFLPQLRLPAGADGRWNPARGGGRPGAPRARAAAPRTRG